VQHLIRVFDVRPEGRLGPARLRLRHRVAGEPGVPDGMKCDAHGNVWVSGPGGVWVYSPRGDLLGKLRFPNS
jgi:gluconolactonase